MGFGRAEKAQVQQMVALLLGLDTLPTPHDASDALAIAVCHANTAAGPAPTRLTVDQTHVRSWRQYRPEGSGS